MATEELVATIRAELNQFRTQMQEMTRVTERASQQSAQAMSTFNTAIANVRQGVQALGVSLSVAGFVQFTKSAVETANQFNAFALSLKNATGSLAAAGQSMAFVRTEAGRLGLDLTKALEGFARLTNATRGTALAGDATREIFTALSETSRVLGLSTEEYGRALTAVGQIALKGRVQQEELLQLAEAGIPIYSALAQSLGKTTGELAKMLEQGQVSATALGDAFRLLRQQTDGVAEASDSFAARTVRMSNAMTELLNVIGRLITESPNARRLIAELTKTLELAAQTNLSKEFGFIETTMKELALVAGLANTALAFLTNTTLKDMEKQLQDTRLRIGLTTEELERQERLSSLSWLTYLRNLGGLLPVGQQVNAQLTTLRENLAQLHLQEQAQMNLVASLAQTQRFARRPLATEGDIVGPATPAVREFLPQITAIETQWKNVQSELSTIETQMQVFGQADSLKLARTRVTELEKGLTKIGEILSQAPEIVKRLPPEVVKVVDVMKLQLAAAQQQVKVLETRASAEKQATQDAIKADKERLQATETTQKETQELTLKTFALEHAQLTDKVAELRKAGVAETVITAFEAEKRQDIRIRETTKMFELLEEEALKREETEAAQTKILEEENAKRLKFTNALAALEAKGTRTRVDDLRERLDQERAAFAAQGRSQEELEQHAAASHAFLQREQTEETAKALKEQSREYEQFAKRVQDTTADTLFNALSRRIQGFKDLLTSVKNFFLRILSQMIAAAITKPIIIPVVTAVTGAFGLNELLGITALTGGATGANGADGAQSTAGLLSQSGNVAQALGLTSTGAIGRFLGTPIGPGFTREAVPAGMQGPRMASGAFFSQTPTLGQTIGAGVGGVTLGQAGTQIAGLQGTRAERIGSLTGGTIGAIAGAYFGPIGSFLGGIAGSFLGGLAGSLFGGKPPTQRFQVSGAQVGGLSFQPGIGITGLDTFLLNTRSGNLGQAGGPLHTGLHSAVTGLFSQLSDTLRQFPEAIQERAMPHLEGLAQHFEVHFRSLNLKGQDVAKQLEKWIAEDLPRLFESTFSDMLERLQRVSPLLQKFDEAISALEQRQAQMLEMIRGARQTIREAFFSPAMLFEARQETLTGLLTQFRGGSATLQAQLAPQIVGLTQEVFRLGAAQEVLGDDEEALRELQRDMLDILTEVETATRSVFEQHIQATEAQRQILLDQFAVTANIEALMRDSVMYLRTLTEFFQPIGSFQTVPGQVHRVAATGLGFLHRGELVGRPFGDSFNSNINITINAAPGSDATGIANATASAIRNQQRQLQVRERYRQRGTL